MQIEYQPIDYLFADTLQKKSKQLLSEKARNILVKLFYYSRIGHLCIELEKEEYAHISELKHIFNENIIQKFNFSRPIVRFEKYLYLEKNWQIETSIINQLKWLLDQEKMKITLNEEPKKEDLTDEQQAILHAVSSENIMILSGGPGRGKTYTAAKLISLLPSDFKVIITAPTGKATTQLYNQICTFTSDRLISAKTLHALIGDFNFVSPANKIDADFIIVDESSMMDAQIFSRFIQLIGPKTKILFMGDEEQLPSVEAGNIFPDLCSIAKETHSIPYVHLTKCFRMERQEILDFSNQILELNPCSSLWKDGEAITFFEIESFSFDFFYDQLEFWLQVENDNLTHAKNLLNKHMILTAFKLGPLGSFTLNEKIYRYLSSKKQNLIVPILITKTNYELGVFNGQIGFSIGDRFYLEEENNTWRDFPLHALPSYELAYAISIHKSQGSEYDTVSLILPPGSENFGKEIIYTGVTRTKKELNIISSKETFLLCIQHKPLRNSCLVNRFIKDRNKKG